MVLLGVQVRLTFRRQKTKPSPTRVCLAEKVLDNWQHTNTREHTTLNEVSNLSYHSAQLLGNSFLLQSWSGLSFCCFRIFDFEGLRFQNRTTRNCASKPAFPILHECLMILEPSSSSVLVEPSDSERQTIEKMLSRPQVSENQFTVISALSAETVTGIQNQDSRYYISPLKLASRLFSRGFRGFPDPILHWWWPRWRSQKTTISERSYAGLFEHQ